MNAISFALYGNIVLRYVKMLSWFYIKKLTMYLVWRSVQHMHCKCACYKSQPWLRFHYGTIGERRNLHNIHSGNGDGGFRVLLMLMLISCSCSLIFPRWDVICVIFSVFLLTYTYQEGKSNYFKGSILTLSYIVLLAGFYFTPSIDQDSIAINIAPPPPPAAS